MLALAVVLNLLAVLLLGLLLVMHLIDRQPDLFDICNCSWDPHEGHDPDCAINNDEEN